jgi:hypothetical protein
VLKRLATVEKRFSDAQADVHATRAEKAALESQLQAQRTAPLRQGINQQYQQPFDGYGGAAPQFDPGLAQQQTDVSRLALELAAEGQIKGAFSEVQEALDIKLSTKEKDAVRAHLNAIGSFDVMAGVKVICHERLMEEAREKAKASTLKAAQESQKAVVQTPPGQTGQPKREYSKGIRGYGEILDDLEAQGRI